ncbi:hypothetical protein VPHK339_0059 [Vibrio phage K339]
MYNVGWLGDSRLKGIFVALVKDTKTTIHRNILKTLSGFKSFCGNNFKFCRFMVFWPKLLLCDHYIMHLLFDVTCHALVTKF